MKAEFQHQTYNVMLIAALNQLPVPGYNRSIKNQFPVPGYNRSINLAYIKSISQHPPATWDTAENAQSEHEKCYFKNQDTQADVSASMTHGPTQQTIISAHVSQV